MTQPNDPSTIETAATITSIDGASVDPASADHDRVLRDLPPTIGPVRLIREIGRGGMGVVYLGHHDVLSKDVAVKFLFNAARDEASTAEFLRGARAAAALRHLSLTTIHHADVLQLPGTNEPLPYIVMEYIDGQSLDDIIRAHGPLTIPATLAALQGAAEATAELHRRDFVHRDLKTGNVLIDREGRAYLTDFGLACERQVKSSGGASRIAGTPAYMAPEMFAGAITPRTDVYALGVLAFVLLTGAAPFDGSLDEIAQRHRELPLPVERLRERGVTDAFIDVIERAMHKDAAFRYKTAEHFLRAMRDAAGDEYIFTRGTRELAKLAVQSRSDAKAQSSVAGTLATDPSTSYVDLIGTLAYERRRQQAESSASANDVRASESMQSGLRRDVPCIGCDYNLRGASPDARCPECGRGVSDSLVPDRIMFMPVEWSTRVARGLRWTGLTITLFIPILLAAGGTLALLRTLDDSRAMNLLSVAVFVAATCAPIAFVIHGVWLATTTTTALLPTTEASRRCERWSQLARWTIVPTLALLLISMLGTFVGEVMPAVAHATDVVTKALAVALAIVGYPIWMRYLTHLVERIPAREARATRRWIWLVIVAPIGVALWWARRHVSPPWQPYVKGFNSAVASMLFAAPFIVGACITGCRRAMQRAIDLSAPLEAVLPSEPE